MPPSPEEISQWVAELIEELVVFEAPPWAQLTLFGDEGRPLPGPAEAG